MIDKPLSPRFNDDPAIPEIYVNKIVNTIFDGHTVVVTFGTSRISAAQVNEPSNEGPAIYVTCRLALSPPAAIELANSVRQILTAVQNAQGRKPTSNPKQTD